ncbi:MAG: hypothetical protein ACRDGM_08025 [bacterium]
MNRPREPFRWFWGLTSWGRKLLVDLEETDQAIEKIRDARLRESDRYLEIARQSEALQQAAHENSFVKQLSRGFNPRMT